MTNLIAFENGILKVPDQAALVKIEGDGVGPEIWAAAQPALEKAAEVSGRKILWQSALAGEEAFRKTGSPLPPDTLAALAKYRVALKGPLGTPVGSGIRSLNVALRKTLDLYACVRPVRHIPAVPSPVRNPELIDMIIFRENTEDVYAGLEWPAESAEAQKLILFLDREMGVKVDPQAAVGLKPMTKKASQRLVRMALEWALKEKRPSLTLVHKGNIMKFTEGAFRQWGYDLAAGEFPEQTVPQSQARSGDGRLIIKDCLADNMFMQALLRPEDYSILAMPNLNGDYLSDALAAQVGGLGMAPGANIGSGFAVFEATHGTAPKHAGFDRVNPSSLLLSGALMFDYLGWTEAARSLRQAVDRTFQDGFLTYELARLVNKDPVSCSEFGRAVLERIS